MTRSHANITPNHPLIREYHRSLASLRSQGVQHELGLRHAFQNLLADSARLHGWNFIAELSAKSGGHNIRLDGTTLKPPTTQAVPEVWMVPDGTRIGYEISFTRYFYQPKPLRTLEEIRADILAVESEAEGLLEELVQGAAK